MSLQRHLVVAVQRFLVLIISASTRETRIPFALLVVTTMAPRMLGFGIVTSTFGLGTGVTTSLVFGVRAMLRDYVTRDGSPLYGEKFCLLK